jgi:hypothetical protein
VLSWLTRLFKQRVEAEGEPAPTPSPAPAAVIEAVPVTKGETQVAVLELTADPTVAAPAAIDAKEICPNCGRTSVFAGPPGQRFCMHCALRDELFDQNAV